MVFLVEDRPDSCASARIQARTREIPDRLVEIEHGERHAAALELVNLMLDAGAVLADEADGELALARHTEVGGAVNIAVGMTADDDGLGPAWDERGTLRR